MSIKVDKFNVMPNTLAAHEGMKCLLSQCGSKYTVVGHRRIDYVWTNKVGQGTTCERVITGKVK